jgi:CRISPR-associated protein (TIGR02584 family)
VVVLTTARGKTQIERELFGPDTVWQSLRRALRAEGDALCLSEIAVFQATDRRSGRFRDLDDIRSPEDNAVAADFLLDHVRRFAENRDARLIASIAGGRKTMSALLYACVSLLGRETDRITHVLVREDLEQRRDPKFYFPQTPAEARGIQLADIPFVPLRNRFAELGRLPGHFHTLVSHYARQIERDAHRRANVRLDPERRAVEVDGVAVKLPPHAFALLAYMLEVNQAGRVPESLDAAIEPLRERAPSWLPPDTGQAEQVEEALLEIRKKKHQIRAALRKRGLEWLPGTGAGEALRLPPFRLLPR